MKYDTNRGIREIIIYPYCNGYMFEPIISLLYTHGWNKYSICLGENFEWDMIISAFLVGGFLPPIWKNMRTVGIGSNLPQGSGNQSSTGSNMTPSEKQATPRFWREVYSTFVWGKCLKGYYKETSQGSNLWDQIYDTLPKNWWHLMLPYIVLINDLNSLDVKPPSQQSSGKMKV